MRTFILQKDIVSPVKEYNLKSGSKFTIGGTGPNANYINGLVAFIPEVVENNPEWFKEEKIREEVEIYSAELNLRSDGKWWDHLFHTRNPILPDKWNAIKKAIESVLNDDCYFDANRLEKRLDELKEKQYTEEDMRKSYYRGIMDHGLAPNARDFYFRHFLNHILK